MKRVKKTTIGIALLLGCICEIAFILKPSAHRSEGSLDLHLSSNVLPVLNEEINKYIARLDAIHPRDHVSLGRDRAVQNSLACLLQKGTWTDMSVSENERPGTRRQSRQRVVSSADTRPSFVPNDSCSNSDLSFEPQITSFPDLCLYHPNPLPTKKILFVGPETTFYLHTNILKALEQHENRSHHCLGSEFCTFHQICRAPRSPDSSEPFFPPGGYKKYPSNRELASTHSGVLKYLLSSSLYAGSNAQDGRYVDPLVQVDEETGVRRRERYWLLQASKSDLLVLNRGPLPAPAWTYDGTRRGNWTFIRQQRQGHDRIEQEGGRKRDTASLYGESIMNAALSATMARFLPEIVETLSTLAQIGSKKKRFVVWHGSWYMHPTCTIKEGTSKGVLDSGLDPWTLYYNAQVYMQNHIVRSLLPQYSDALFVPLDIPIPQSMLDIGHPKKSIGGRRDCLRFEFGSALEEAMRTALTRGLSVALNRI